MRGGGRESVAERWLRRCWGGERRGMRGEGGMETPSATMLGGDETPREHSSAKEEDSFARVRGVKRAEHLA